MNNDLKSKLDAIINNTSGTYPTNDIKGLGANGMSADTKGAIDKHVLREKISLNVLSDLVHAMMSDETNPDVDRMIDDRIMKHIQNDYQGTCNSYLCKACDTTKDPMWDEVIQEIDKKVDEIVNADEKGADTDTYDIDTNSLLAGVDSYEDLRQRLKDEVSQKIINDVSKVITKSKDAPSFDGIDDKLSKDENPEENNSVNPETGLTESVIVNLSGSLYMEEYNAGNEISREDALEMAIVEYCINKMDRLLKQETKENIYTKYNI